MFAVLAQNNVEPEKERKLANKVQQKSKLIKSAPFLSYQGESSPTPLLFSGIYAQACVYPEKGNAHN